MVQVAELSPGMSGALATLRGLPRTEIRRLETQMLRMPQVDCPLQHHFAPGVYVRQCFMPAGSQILGHRHKTEHLNIVMYGRATVGILGDAEGELTEVIGPCVFASKPGVRKILRIWEDMLWGTVHVTGETNLQRLEAELIEKSPEFEDHQSEIESFQRRLESRLSRKGQKCLG